MSKSFDLADVLGIEALPAYLAQVEECIDAALSHENSRMGKAVLRLTRKHGKRLRPALVTASALLAAEQPNDSVIKAAAAIELIHIGSLVHDDIIDEAASRWNIPTINAREGVDYAVLGGDFLFAKACALATEASQEAGMLAADTIARLCSGQSAELAVLHDASRSEQQYEQAISGKTSALLSAACAMGAICTKQPGKHKNALASFGSDFGKSFQLVDDVLDFLSTDELMGKPVGNDIKEGVYTLPVILALQSPQGSRVKNELKKTNISQDALIDVLLKTGAIEHTVARAEQYNLSAKQTVSNTFGEPARHLALLPAIYLEWALSNLVASHYKGLITRSV